MKITMAIEVDIDFVNRLKALLMISDKDWNILCKGDHGGIMPGSQFDYAARIVKIRNLFELPNGEDEMTFSEYK